MKYQLKQYGAALAAALAIFLTLSVYLFFRRGYYNLFIANKAFAGAAAALLGLVLLIGPVNRLQGWGKTWLQYRKELGIVAYILAAVHVLISLPPWPWRFNWPFVYGLTAIIVLSLIFLISNNFFQQRIGYKHWWRLQYWGIRLAFLLVGLHVFIMKWRGWVGWYKSGGASDLARPDWPGAGILVGWLMAFVVLIRLAEWLHPRIGRAAAYFSAAALPLIYVFSFWWGSQLGR